MEITPYSLCPGGTGKKIKFCCAHQCDNFIKIVKMLDGQQYNACVQYIDTLLAKEPDRPCLLAFKCLALEMIPDKMEDLFHTAKQFYKMHPENPIALSEWCRARMVGGLTLDDSESHLPDDNLPDENTSDKSEDITPENYEDDESIEGKKLADLYADEKIQSRFSEACALLEKAFLNSGENLYQQVSDKILMLIHTCAKAGLISTARAWVLLLIGANPDEKHLTDMFRQLCGMEAVPLELRENLILQHTHSNAPWAEEFNACVTLAESLHWTQAVEKLTALQEEGVNEPELWYNLAVLYSWKAEITKSRKAWNKFAQCKVPEDNAILAQTRALYLSPLPLEDPIQTVTLEYVLTETEGVKDALLLSETFSSIPFDIPPASDQATPVALYSVLDAPKITSLEGLEVTDLPIVVGYATLWGKQTDRPARLEIRRLLPSGVDSVKEDVEAQLGKWLLGEGCVKPSATVSLTLDCFSREIYLPPYTEPEKRAELQFQLVRDLLLNRWIYFPLGVLKNRSLIQAVQDTSAHVMINAVLNIISRWIGHDCAAILMPQLREKLGIPPRAEIKPLPDESIDFMSPTFLERIPLECITPKQLEDVFRIASLYSVESVMITSSRLLISDANQDPLLRIHALTVLLMNRTGTIQEQHQWIELGQALCAEVNSSDCMFNIFELELAFQEQRHGKAMQILKHLSTDHIKEPLAQQTLMQFYKQAQSNSGMGEPAGGMNRKKMMDPETPEPPASGIWTPDSDIPRNSGPNNSDSGQGSGLWVPGMD